MLKPGYVFAITLWGTMLHAAPDDDCADLISSEVRVAITRDFPSYRLPTQSDNSAEDIARVAPDDGARCLGVALGEFRDRSTATALLLTRSDADQTILVVAFLSGSSWRTEVLREWGPGRSGLFVRVAPPGKFARTEALDGPANEPGERVHLVSKRPGILSGVLERSGVAYFFTKTGWVHVWVSD